MLAFAFATVTASPVTRAISPDVTMGDEANPQAPSTMTRTPKPKLSVSAIPGTSSVLFVPRSGLMRIPMI
jgi:hypothetical protein